jgi:hypothetical protein
VDRSMGAIDSSGFSTFRLWTAPCIALPRDRLKVPKDHH